MPRTNFFTQHRHNFQYRAWAPWPELEMPQQDWINGIEEIENWLERNVGDNGDAWAWDRVDLCYQGRYVGVAFEDHRDRLLFLLRWGFPK